MWCNCTPWQRMRSTKNADLIGHTKFLPWQQLNGWNVTRPFPLSMKGVACEASIRNKICQPPTPTVCTRLVILKSCSTKWTSLEGEEDNNNWWPVRWTCTEPKCMNHAWVTSGFTRHQSATRWLLWGNYGFSLNTEAVHSHWFQVMQTWFNYHHLTRGVEELQMRN